MTAILSTKDAQEQAALSTKFLDFDQPEIHDKTINDIKQGKIKNFVVEFGVDKCQIACDLSVVEFKALMHRTRPQLCPVQWINIWGPAEQDPGVIEVIGQHYRFSRRLRLSMQEWDAYKPWLERIKAEEKQETERLGPKPKRKSSSVADMEKGASSWNETATATSKEKLSAAEHCPDRQTLGYLMIQDTLNYTTVDHMADKFICIGANWLHLRPEVIGGTPPSTLIPPKHWAWYALCNDKGSSWKAQNPEHTEAATDKPAANTVITIHEAPRFEHDQGIISDDWKTKELWSMRSNTVKVLSQLSQVGVDAYQGQITQLASVRSHLQDIARIEDNGSGLLARNHASITGLGGMDVSLDNISSTELEGASNLFYYLFEDYQPIIPILIESKKKLNKMRMRVLQTARPKDHSDTSDIIPELYTLSKELRELKHLFESYKMLIQRILGASSSATVPGFAEHGLVPTTDARLAPTARDRFDRLGDRLQLLMLNTLQEYLEEQKSQSDTYFNLTNQKDSQATERLTRSATMLAKLSVFFLPISFMTSYFSVQIPELNNQWTGTTYWAAFGIVAFFSFLCVFFFGKLLETISEGLDGVPRAISEWFAAKFDSLRGTIIRGEQIEVPQAKAGIHGDD